jgi:hypothetical protein
MVGDQCPKHGELALIPTMNRKSVPLAVVVLATSKAPNRRKQKHHRAGEGGACIRGCLCIWSIGADLR